jgi:uncharacterized protein YceK
MMRNIFLAASSFVLLAGCASLSTSDVNKGTSDAATQARYEQAGGSRVETAIWSTDPKKKTLPQAIGESVQ